MTEIKTITEPPPPKKNNNIKKKNNKTRQQQQQRLNNIEPFTIYVMDPRRIYKRPAPKYFYSTYL